VPEDTIKRLGAQLNAALLSFAQLEQEIRGQHPAGETSEAHLRLTRAQGAAAEIIARRRARHAHFGAHEIFGEPAWDILLDLYVRQSGGEQISVKSACVNAGVPANTALRWLHALELEGLLCCEDDPGDPQRRLVRLSRDGFDRMTDYFEEIANEGHG
jgi:hypothetical protein